MLRCLCIGFGLLPKNDFGENFGDIVFFLPPSVIYESSFASFACDADAMIVGVRVGVGLLVTTGIVLGSDRSTLLLLLLIRAPTAAKGIDDRWVGVGVGVCWGVVGGF